MLQLLWWKVFKNAPCLLVLLFLREFKLGYLLFARHAPQYLHQNQTMVTWKICLFQPSWEPHFTYRRITKLFPTLVLSSMNIIFFICCQTHPNMLSAKDYLSTFPIVGISYLKLLPLDVPFISQQKYGMTKFTKVYAIEHVLKCMNTLHIQMSKFKCSGFLQWLCQTCCIHSMHLDRIDFVQTFFT